MGNRSTTDYKTFVVSMVAPAAGATQLWGWPDIILLDGAVSLGFPEDRVQHEQILITSYVCMRVLVGPIRIGNEN